MPPAPGPDRLQFARAPSLHAGNQQLETAPHACFHSPLALGNGNSDLRSTTPAACPAAIAATSLDARMRRPAEFSNWLPLDAPPEERNRTLAAPGVDVVSTYLVDGVYSTMSGT